jgi:hypothetical protein
MLRDLFKRAAELSQYVHLLRIGSGGRPLRESANDEKNSKDDAVGESKCATHELTYRIDALSPA